MESAILTEEDIEQVAKKISDNGKFETYELKQASDRLLGYLGEHLHLTIHFENKLGPTSLFVKRLPIDNELKTDYIRKCNFFKKEYAMLNELFKEFEGEDFPDKWRPKAFLLKKELFIFENMTEMGYVIPNQQKCFNYKEMICVVRTLAKFHAASYSYEENVKKLKKRKYEIYEDYKQYLSEPPGGFNWRVTGMKAVIDFLCQFSENRHELKFRNLLELRIPQLYEDVVELMKPNKKYRNVVTHRDLWSNNILIKYSNGEPVHAVIVDFQTVLYSSPFLDLSSLMYFNTNSQFRKNYSADIITFYYSQLKKCLEKRQVDIATIINEDQITEAYEESIIFGLTQACLIVPLIAMDNLYMDRYFNNPITFYKVSEVTRSEELLEIANKDEVYKKRVLELFEEMVARCIACVDVPSKNSKN